MAARTVRRDARGGTRPRPRGERRQGLRRRAGRRVPRHRRRRSRDRRRPRARRRGGDEEPRHARRPRPPRGARARARRCGLRRADRSRSRGGAEGAPAARARGARRGGARRARPRARGAERRPPARPRPRRPRRARPRPRRPGAGGATLEPTVVRAGEARNVVPAEATALLDLRTVPGMAGEAIAARVRAAVAAEVRVVSDRFAPRRTPPGSALLTAARAARPAARLYGSATLSDWALLPDGVAGIKAGPGRSERSHTPDEFVLEEEIVDGAAFYEGLVRAFADEVARERGGAA
ncbi:MAG: peptidase dimerization domain-containing protein [Thermoanaerobaculia bacterium]|nr:peptidase dimerization domain-containing protein [Thermoanaerobaculia bacterium]